MRGGALGSSGGAVCHDVDVPGAAGHGAGVAGDGGGVMIVSGVLGV